MKKFLLIIVTGGSLSVYSIGQEIVKIGGTEKDAISKIGNVPVESISKIGNIPSPYYYKNCKEIKDNKGDATDGLYTIDPDGEGEIDPFDCYCDMTTDGGGWTLVLLSNIAPTGCPAPSWINAVSGVNLKGTFSADITSFDMLVGLRYWNLLGTRARLDMGLSPSFLSHQAYYDLSLNESNWYALEMSNESVTINSEGTSSPGLYTYHNGRGFTTYDADHDASTGNCSNNYNNASWWYGNCWSGSFWGGGGEVYQDAPYWTGTGTEYFNYGSIWMR